MRFFSVLWQDVRYQARYGFYWLYMFISVVYMGLLLVIPPAYKKMAASVIVLSDPAMLGVFFIGGIWLLEREDGLHRYRIIAPVKTIAYIVSKGISLSVIAAISATLIAIIGIGGTADFFILSVGVLAGAFVFTVIGLIMASYARSVNHYMLIATPPTVILTIPAFLTALGITHPLFEIMPGTALWRIVAFAVGADGKAAPWHWMIIGAWLIVALFLANRRIPKASQSSEEGGL